MEKKKVTRRRSAPKEAQAAITSPFITEFDQYLFGQGVHYEIYKKMEKRVFILPSGHRMRRAFA